MFWHTSIQGCREECKVPLGREFIRIPVSVLWSRASFADFYKSTNNTKSTVKVNQYQDNYISRRYAPHESKIFRTYPSQEKH